MVVENHVNVLRPTGQSALDASILAALLNSEPVDQLFRCLSGTVAVSATELHALPLPAAATLAEIGELLASLPGGVPSVEEAAQIDELVLCGYRSGAG
jgi:adenine-specific DNA-methyltransferase